MAMHPDVSIIIVSWNTREILCQCLESIGKTSGGMSLEVWVVDNGSSDGTCEAVADRFPHVRLVRNSENLGFSRGNNIGILQSTGRYLCLINSDVLVLQECIQKLARFMDQNPTVGVAGPRILNPDGTLQVSCRRFPGIWNNLCQAIGFNYMFPKSAFFGEPFMKYWSHDQVRKVDVLSGCFWIVRREALDQVGLLDEGFFFYGEDNDWCRRFHDAGWDVMFDPEAQAIHMGGASSRLVPIRFYLEMQKADLHYWRKHHGPIGQFTYATIILIRQFLRVIASTIQYMIRPSARPISRLKLRRAVVCLHWLFTGRAKDLQEAKTHVQAL